MIDENSFISEDKNKDLWLILRAKLYEEKIKAAFSFFRENGIEPILIKGWAAAREYPKPHLRVFNDNDFCIDPRLRPKCSEKFIRKARSAFNLDLHFGLRHLDQFDWDDLFDNSMVHELDNADVRILRPEDHLRVLSIHWLTDGGARKDRLLDIKYLLENNGSTFDWMRCLGRLEEKRRVWILTAIGLAEKFYGLPKQNLSGFDFSQPIPQWIFEALEKEWRSDLPLKPLHTLLGNKKDLFRQIKKRLPPNAIQATIEVGGSFDDRSRIPHQIGSLLLRIGPSVKRIFSTFFVKPEKNNGEEDK